MNERKDPFFEAFSLEPGEIRYSLVEDGPVLCLSRNKEINRTFSSSCEAGDPLIEKIGEFGDVQAFLLDNVTINVQFNRAN